MTVVVIPDHAKKRSMVILTSVVESLGSEALRRQRQPYRRLRSASSGESGWCSAVSCRPPYRSVGTSTRGTPGARTVVVHCVDDRPEGDRR